MTETPRLKLPLLQPSQAQKHVTVNEALTLLDGLAQLSLASRMVAEPPVPAIDGVCHAVPSGATGAWAGRSGQVAIGANGGWVFVLPAEGWRAWVADEAREVVFTGGGWSRPPLDVTANGGAARFLSVEAEHAITPGGAQSMAASIPVRAMVFAVSARVIQTITGSVTTWRLGTTGADNRFGSGMGLAVGSFSSGILGAPMTYFTAAPLLLTPNGGTFSSGRLRVVLHYMLFDTPGV